jgi:hypothetical protein
MHSVVLFALLCGSVLSVEALCRPYILFVGFGIHGDNMPMVNLANFANHKGHRVVFAVSTNVAFSHFLQQSFSNLEPVLLNDVEALGETQRVWVGKRPARLMDTAKALKVIFGTYTTAFSSMETLFANETCPPKAIISSFLCPWAMDIATKVRV